MGGFDRYIKRFDEVETKRGRATQQVPGQKNQNPWIPRVLICLLACMTVAAAIVYGPRLAGASGADSIHESSGPEAERDYATLRAMTFADIQKVQDQRMETLFKLKQAKAAAAEVEAANQAAWRVNKVARELNPD